MLVLNVTFKGESILETFTIFNSSCKKINDINTTNYFKSLFFSIDIVQLYHSVSCNLKFQGKYENTRAEVTLFPGFDH